MKQKFLLLFSVFIIAIVFNNNDLFAKSKPTYLFSTKNSDGWVYVINNKKLPVKDVFEISYGVLRISGISNGYIRTKKQYTNYELNLEWRWTKKLGNSGVLVHIQQKDTIWPVCYQVQQKADAAGDIICMNGLKAKECTDTIKFNVKKMLPSNEKPLGEWNSMKVICDRNTMKVYINDVLQNSITYMNVKKGYIGFQNEGTAMEFRNFTIK